MAYWLFKSEPNVFSWEDLAAKGKAADDLSHESVSCNQSMGMNWLSCVLQPAIWP